MPLLGLYARAATAIAPIFVALALRLIFGRGRVSAFAFSAATAWFAINVLAAPYSARMRQDLTDLATRVIR
jgi:hypothetical protein